jgi:hypothetical protein
MFTFGICDPLPTPTPTPTSATPTPTPTPIDECDPNNPNCGLDELCCLLGGSYVCLEVTVCP